MNLRWLIAQKAEIRWWKNYLNGKNVEEYLVWKKNYWTDLLTKIKTPLELENKDLEILDAGCGPAGIFINLSNKVTAIDPLLDKYQSELLHFNPENYPTVNFKNISIESFETPDKFDLIFCMNAINHVSNIDLSYSNLISKLKPNGLFIVSTDAHNYSILKYLFRLLRWDILHPCQYDLAEYEQFLIDYKLTILETHLLKRDFIFSYYMQVAVKSS